MGLKIEGLNLPTGQALPGKEMAGAASGAVLAKGLEGRGGVTPPPQLVSADSISLSIPSPVSGEKLSTLLSDLIKLLNAPDEAVVGAPLALLENLFYKGEEPASFLKDFIEKSGLLYETKILKGDVKALEDDLKGLILRFIEKNGEKSEAGKIANTLVKDIEAKQLLNVKGKEDGIFYFQIPVLLPQGPSTADIYVMRDGKGNGEYKGDAHRVGFSIELREAGLVSVDAIVAGNSVSIRIQAEKAEFLELMKAHLPDLSERLSGYGMKASFVPNINK